MFIVMFHLRFDQIFHELGKRRVWISFLPFPPSRDTDVPTVSFDEALLYPGVGLELVPVGGDYPGEGVPGDHEGDCLLELVDVGQSSGPRPEGTMELEEVLVIAGILDEGNKDPGQ